MATTTQMSARERRQALERDAATNLKTPEPSEGNRGKELSTPEMRQKLSDARIEHQTTGVESVPLSDETIEMLRLNSLVDSYCQNRVRYPEDEIEDLAHSMRDRQLTPIRVRRLQSGELEIISGHRRVRAARMLGWEYIKGTITQATDKEVAVDLLVANEAQQTTTDYERALGYERLLGFGYTQADIARMTGQKRQMVSRRLTMLKLPEKIRMVLDQTPDVFSSNSAGDLLKILENQPGVTDYAAASLAMVIAGDWTMTQFVEKIMFEAERLKKNEPAATAETAKPSPMVFSDKSHRKFATLDCPKAGVFNIRLDKANLAHGQSVLDAIQRAIQATADQVGAPT